MGKRHHPRAFVDRFFLTWLDENRDRFKIQPGIIRCGRDGVYFEFEGWPPALNGFLSRRSGISLWADHNGVKCWDSFCWCDISEARSGEGYFCKMCDTSVEIYPNRETLWQEHVFEPFLDWCNEVIAKSDRLAFFAIENKCSWIQFWCGSVKPSDYLVHVAFREPENLEDTDGIPIFPRR